MQLLQPLLHNCFNSACSLRLFYLMGQWLLLFNWGKPHYVATEGGLSFAIGFASTQTGSCLGGLVRGDVEPVLQVSGAFHFEEVAS